MTTKEAYEAYLQSGDWKHVRALAFQMWGHSCAVCGKPDLVQAHHIFYAEEWTDTKPEHLMPLCRYHHKAVDYLWHRGRVTGAELVPAMRERIVRELGGNQPMPYQPSKKEKRRAKKRRLRELRAKAKYARKLEKRKRKGLGKQAEGFWRAKRDGYWQPGGLPSTLAVYRVGEEPKIIRGT